MEDIKQLFRVWHRRGEIPPERWARAAERAQAAVLHRARSAPRRKEAQNIAARFRDHGDYYFLFLEVPGLEPTNNAMERQFRQVVIDRKITQGTRGESGRRWCERIWTVLATCGQQGRSAYEFICQAILASWGQCEMPTLLAAPS